MNFKPVRSISLSSKKMQLFLSNLQQNKFYAEAVLTQPDRQREEVENLPNPVNNGQF